MGKDRQKRQIRSDKIIGHRSFMNSILASRFFPASDESTRQVGNFILESEKRAINILDQRFPRLKWSKTSLGEGRNFIRWI